MVVTVVVVVVVAAAAAADPASWRSPAGVFLVVLPACHLLSDEALSLCE